MGECKPLPCICAWIWSSVRGDEFSESWMGWCMFESAFNAPAGRVELHPRRTG